MSKAVRRKIENAEKKGINDELRQKDKTFVLFYATWCPFSQRFLPVFEEYARGHPQECMSVIVDERPDLCEEYSIEYYPTVLLFRKGKVHKRLDAEPGVGLNKKQLAELAKNP
jgi:thiol-disulfide isomerase/thioredoxin